MYFKVIVCLIILAIVPFSYQTNQTSDPKIEEAITKLKGMLKIRSDECGKKTDKDVRKLAMEIQLAEPRDKVKLKKQWLDLIICLADIRNFQKKIVQYGALKKEATEAEKHKNSEAAAAKKRKGMETLAEYAESLRKLLEEHADFTQELDEQNKINKDYFEATLEIRKAECGDKTDEDVKKLAITRSFAKTADKDKLEKKMMDLIVCLEELKILREELSHYD